MRCLRWGALAGDGGRCDDDDLTEKKQSYVLTGRDRVDRRPGRCIRYYPTSKQRIIHVLVTETKARSWAQDSRQNGFLDGVEHPKGTNQRER